YGRGGRGWRDLFSDLLAIFLIDPQSASDEIQNEFLGIRVDGTNATIVGTKPGEFIADRNQVPRTWSEHGTWPFFVLNFYMEQTGDYDVLFKDFTYWKDAFVFRSKKRDDAWSTEEYGNKQKTADGSVYRGTILEHTLIQQLSSFFHVGTHNNILLEGADWNDTYDMARDRGESVCFFNWYAHNLKTIADVLTFLKQTKGITTIKLLKEMTVLLDSMPGQTKIPYDSPEAKRNHLFAYYDRVKHVVSGERVDVPVDDLIADLRGKADAVYEHIRTNELITTKDGDIFYNGHYDNDENRVHGEHPAGIRIDLTSQVLPTMFGTATDEQIPQIFASVKKYLRDPDTGGLRLCSEFKEDRMYFGRLTGFVFGHKEHGGKWMQQNVMYILGLYRRGFVNEAYEIFTDVFTMCHNSKISKIFPGIPSYFEMDGRGAYHYLTGSATWLMIAIVTQMYGIRGRRGDFVINPKLKVEQFGNSGQCTIQCNFRNRRMRVTYRNPQAVEWDSYAVKSVTVNGNKVSFNIDGPRATLSAESFDSVFTKEHNEVWVALG
ncbi:MAG: cellobiose phosphorylase, partial [Phycisphaerae bacterium]|nr:cellobiose phosphorylase [Phycisphaerae bacterium]